MTRSTSGRERHRGTGSVGPGQVPRRGAARHRRVSTSVPLPTQRPPAVPALEVAEEQSVTTSPRVVSGRQAIVCILRLWATRSAAARRPRRRPLRSQPRRKGQGMGWKGSHRMVDRTSDGPTPRCATRWWPTETAEVGGAAGVSAAVGDVVAPLRDRGLDPVLAHAGAVGRRRVGLAVRAAIPDRADRPCPSPRSPWEPSSGSAGFG